MPVRFEEMVAAETARAAGQGRALAPLAAGKRDEPLDCFSGLQANFLAHLIATRDRLPQTLMQRRASPDVAVSLYSSGGTPPRRARSHTA